MARRPRSPTPGRRDKQVIFWVSEAERKWLHDEARSHGLDLSEFLRARAGLKTTSPLVASMAYQGPGSKRVRQLDDALAGLQAGIDNARALLEGGGEE